jgi:hypothetical protein
MPVQIRCLRRIGPLMMGITAPALWVRYQTLLVVGGWLCYTALCLWFRVYGTNSKGFVLFSRRSSPLLSSSWIASTLAWLRSLRSCFPANIQFLPLPFPDGDLYGCQRSERTKAHQLCIYKYLSKNVNYSSSRSVESCKQISKKQNYVQGGFKGYGNKIFEAESISLNLTYIRHIDSRTCTTDPLIVTNNISASVPQR